MNERVLDRGKGRDDVPRAAGFGDSSLGIRGRWMEVRGRLGRARAGAQAYEAVRPEQKGDPKPTASSFPTGSDTVFPRADKV